MRRCLRDTPCPPILDRRKLWRSTRRVDETGRRHLLVSIFVRRHPSGTSRLLSLRCSRKRDLSPRPKPRRRFCPKFLREGRCLPNVSKSRHCLPSDTNRCPLHRSKKTTAAVAPARATRTQYSDCVDRKPRRCRRCFHLCLKLSSKFCRHQLCEKFRAPDSDRTRGQAQPPGPRPHFSDRQSARRFGGCLLVRRFSRSCPRRLICKCRFRKWCCRELPPRPCRRKRHCDPKARPRSRRSRKYLPCRTAESNSGRRQLFSKHRPQLRRNNKCPVRPVRLRSRGRVRPGTVRFDATASR